MSNNKKQHILNNIDLKILESIIKDLQKLSVNQFTEIRETLKKIPNDNESIRNWKENIQFVVNECNQEEYEKVMNKTITIN